MARNVRPPWRRSVLSAASGALIASLGLLGPAAAGQPGAATTRTATAAQHAADTCEPLTTFKAENFEHSSTIDARFDPLRPGTEFTLQGVSNTGGGLLPHKVVLTVTDLVKRIDGVWTRVLWDRDTDDEVLVESELAFQAQDTSGNVWSLGEYPEEFDGAGEFTGTPNTWIAGIDGARAGVLVPGEPRKNKPPFLQGESPTIGFLDCGQVHRTAQDDVCTPTTCYDDVLVIDETSPLDPDGGVQRKFYAPGVGNVQVTAVDDPEGETLALVGKRKLGLAERIAADLEAVGLEARAYENSEIYRQTLPMLIWVGHGDHQAMQVWQALKSKVDRR